MNISITETALRDGQQSLLATRLPFERFAPILEAMDKVGYYAVECWGGATFDSCLRYLDEDPWERLRKIRSAMPNTKLQMLLRGQNILGYKHYPDDVVRHFVRLSVKNGIDIIRIFDALNDLRNVEVAIDETIRQGAHASGDIVYTISPVHTLDRYVEVAKTLEKMGVHSVSIKDMAGILDPKTAYDLVRAIKEQVGIPLSIHTHCTTGLAYMTYLKAVEAGADIIETATAALSGGTSNPATETMVYALDQFGYSSGLQADHMQTVSAFFKKVQEESIASGLLDPLVLTTDPNCLSYQMPGGMFSNLVSQLKAHNALDSLQAVLEEMPRVRADLGYPPLVTPLSQMVGAQATQNVLMGTRYKTVAKEIKHYIKGEYGIPPAPIDETLAASVLGGDPPATIRFAETLPPIFEQTKRDLIGIALSDEDVLSYILFPTIAEKFFASRQEKAGRAVNYAIQKPDEVLNLVNVPDQEAAIIMATVAATINAPLDSLRFLSIRELVSNENENS